MSSAVVSPATPVPTTTTSARRLPGGGSGGDHSPPPLCPMAIIRSTAPARPAGDLGVDGDLVPHLPQAGQQLLRGDHLHVLAGRAVVDGAEVDAGRGAAQLVQHADLGGDQHGAGRGRPRRRSTMSPVDRIFTLSAGTAPAVARYSALVAQPHSGWMYRSASGLACDFAVSWRAVDARRARGTPRPRPRCCPGR